MTTAEPLREPLVQYGVAVPTAAPVRMDSDERMRVRMAALKATRVFPGVVGEYLSRELLSFEEFGMRLSRDGMTTRLIEFVLSSKAATEPA